MRLDDVHSFFPDIVSVFFIKMKGGTEFGTLQFFESFGQCLHDFIIGESLILLKDLVPERSYHLGCNIHLFEEIFNVSKGLFDFKIEGIDIFPVGDLKR